MSFTLHTSDGGYITWDPFRGRAVCIERCTYGSGGGGFIDLKKVLRSGSTVRPYHDYAFFMNRGSRLGSYLTNVTDGDGYKSVRKELRTTLKMRSRLRATIPNPKYVKLEYVRYADD